MSKFRTVTHLIALGIVSAAGWFYLHQQTIAAVAGVIKNNPNASLTTLLPLFLLALYHGSKATS